MELIMTETTKITIEQRTETGKSAARALRREGKVPAIIYGGKGGETKISLSERELIVVQNKGGFLSKLIELDDGKKTIKTLPRELQLHPVKDTPVHVDFIEVTDATLVSVSVKVEFINREKSPGLKLGGILSIVRHKIELTCKAGNIPEILYADLDGQNIGESVHISAIKLPEGCEPTITGRDFTIATIAGRGATSATEETEDDASSESAEGSEE
jgi:large subunit ribosomal protein L25